MVFTDKTQWERRGGGGMGGGRNRINQSKMKHQAYFKRQNKSTRMFVAAKKIK